MNNCKVCTTIIANWTTVGFARPLSIPCLIVCVRGEYIAGARAAATRDLPAPKDMFALGIDLCKSSDDPDAP